MSAPVSAMMTSATTMDTPGMVARNSRAARKGAIASSMRVVSFSIQPVRESMRSRCMVQMNAWCSSNLPVRASTSWGIRGRSRPLARLSNTCGSRSPLMRASSMAREETPISSET